jgi:antitoxin (DNA-binding transcriptional repressor) of toxin-antitoxin stability system
MKTLTITDAKKNLGKWLQAAARGEDVGIISGADIIALRKIQVIPLTEEYVKREYGVSSAELKAFEKRTDARYRKLKREGKLMQLTPGVAQATHRSAGFAEAGLLGGDQPITGGVRQTACPSWLGNPESAATFLRVPRRSWLTAFVFRPGRWHPLVFSWQP